MMNAPFAPGTPARPVLRMRSHMRLLRKPVVAWALFDWANSAFATTVMVGLLPGVLQAVLGRRHERQREHVRTRSRERRRQSRCRDPRALPRRGRRPLRRPRPAARRCSSCWVPRPRPRSRSLAGATGSWRRSCSTRWPRSASPQRTRSTTRLLLDVAEPRRIRRRLGLRLCARLPRRWAAVRTQRLDDAAARALRARRCGRGGALVIRHDRGLVVAVRAAARVRRARAAHAAPVVSAQRAALRGVSGRATLRRDPPVSRHCCCS